MKTPSTEGGHFDEETEPPLTFFTGATGPEVAAAAGEGDGDLPGAEGALRAVLRRAHPTVHHQLHRARTPHAQSQGRRPRREGIFWIDATLDLLLFSLCRTSFNH